MLFFRLGVFESHVEHCRCDLEYIGLHSHPFMRMILYVRFCTIPRDPSRTIKAASMVDLMLRTIFVFCGRWSRLHAHSVGASARFRVEGKFKRKLK